MRLGRNPPSGHGTWVIGPGEFDGPPGSVIFTLTCSPPGHECPNWNLTFDLQAESTGPSGGPALFYYRGDPDDWSDQMPSPGTEPAGPGHRMQAQTA
jgi:hypothetical protein